MGWQKRDDRHALCFPLALADKIAFKFGVKDIVNSGDSGGCPVTFHLGSGLRTKGLHCSRYV